MTTPTMDAEQLKDALLTSPDAIPEIRKVYSGAVQKWSCGNAQVDALAGGPHEGVTWPVYNAVGAAYPGFTRDQKDEALGQLLQIFDGINWGIVNGARGVGHTTGIREPLLLSDIALARSVYWPGLDEGKAKVSGIGFEQFRDTYLFWKGFCNPETVNSDFVVAYAALRSDMSSFGEEYAQHAEPNFLERVLRGIVALRFGFPRSDVAEGTARLKELLPASLHDRVETLRLEGGWADRSAFR